MSRWVVSFGDGSTAFVKSGAGDEAWPVRRERDVLAELEGVFAPALLGSHDEADRATLVVEDLSPWRWPPPYPDDVSALFATLDRVAAHPAPAHLPALEKPASPGWLEIAGDPAPFLGLGLRTAHWLDVSVDDLVAAERAFDPTGDDLVHNDIWSGNLAMADDRCVLVDWAEAHRGSHAVDLGFAHLSLRSEQGPVPTSGFAGDRAFVAWWSASLALRLTTARDTRLDPVIDVGLRQDLEALLVWAAELFALPPR